MSGEGVFEVDYIIDSRKTGKNKEYLIHWLGYDDPAEDTWEPEDNLACPEILAAFLDGEGAEGQRRALRLRRAQAEAHSQSDDDYTSSESSEPLADLAARLPVKKPKAGQVKRRTPQESRDSDYEQEQATAAKSTGKSSKPRKSANRRLESRLSMAQKRHLSRLRKEAAQLDKSIGAVPPSARARKSKKAVVVDASSDWSDSEGDEEDEEEEMFGQSDESVCEVSFKKGISLSTSAPQPPPDVHLPTWLQQVIIDSVFGRWWTTKMKHPGPVEVCCAILMWQGEVVRFVLGKNVIIWGPEDDDGKTTAGDQTRAVWLCLLRSGAQRTRRWEIEQVEGTDDGWSVKVDEREPDVDAVFIHRCWEDAIAPHRDDLDRFVRTGVKVPVYVYGFDDHRPAPIRGVDPIEGILEREDEEDTEGMSGE